MAGRDQQLTVTGHETLGDETMGGNGGPLVTFPGEGTGPHFYVNAPQFHWHQAVTGNADDAARLGLQQIARECFEFGRFVEQRLVNLDEARGKIEWVPGAVGLLQGWMDALDAARQRGELGGKDYGGVIGELQQGVALVDQRRQEDTATVAKLQDALQGVRIEGRKRCAELEALMVEEGEAKR